MSSPVNVGDVAEYCGRVKALADCRCLVSSWTPSKKRVRIVVRDPDGTELYETVVKPGNLKRCGGGC